MTVSSSTNRVSYSGNGTLTTFAYTFKVFDQGDLTVILRSSTGTETVQTITTHYTVTGVGDVGGGNVVFVTAPSATETVVILREQDLTQGLDLVPNDPFPAQSLEESLDKLTFMVQQHEEELGRAIKASRTNTLTGSEFTISAADRANKVFSFDSSGDLSVTQELGTFKGDWAASTAYVERDLVKDTTTNNVFIVTSAHTSSGSLPLTTNTNSAKYEKIIDITNPPGDVTFGGSITTSSSVTAGSFVIGSADINENDLEAIDEVIAGTVAASKAVVVDVNKDISSFRNLTATGQVTFGSLSDGTITVTAFVDEDNMASNSATLVPTQQSVKAYVDAQVATADALSEILVNGNTTGGTNLVVSSGDTLDVNGALDVDGTIILDGNFPTGTSNVALGNTALDTAGATSLNNTAIGSAALTALTTGSDNTAVGNNALTALNTGYDNVAIGSNAGTSITEGVGNVAVGDIAAYYLTSGDANVAVGNGALRTATTPSNNVAIGGSALYLNQTGAGNIALGSSSGYNLTTGSKNVIIGSYDGNEGGLDIRTSDNNLVLSDGDGNIRLYANSSGNVGIGTVSPSTKLEVNGTITADGLTVDGNVAVGSTGASDRQIYMGSVGNLYGALNTDGASGNFNITSGHATTGSTALQFYTAASGTETRRIRIDSAGDISFYEDTGTTAKFFWDASAESLGIGTSSPDAALSIEGHQTVSSNATLPDGSRVARFRPSSNSGGRDYVQFGYGQYSTAGNDYTNLILQPSIGNNGYNSGWYQEVYRPANTTGNGNYFSIGQLTRSVSGQATQTERMRIDSSGNVGIGTSSPVSLLHVQGTDDVVTRIKSTGTNSLARLILQNDGRTWAIDNDGANSDALTFYDATAVSERMRIDTSGNLLVGTTSTNLAYSTTNSGTAIYANGSHANTRDAGIAGYYNRLTSDGNIVVFNRSGTTVGSIASYSGSYLGVGSGDTGLMFHSLNNIIYPHNTLTNTPIDDAISLGSISTRFKSLYLSGGVYLGGTGSANKLDDYEEGTYTPSLQNVTVSYNSRSGTYTKIGRLVFVTIDMDVSSLDTTDVSGFNISLPFTAPATDNGALFSASIKYNESNSLIPSSFTDFLNSGGKVNGSGLSLRAPYSTGGGTNPSYNNMNSSGSIILSFMYYSN